MQFHRVWRDLQHFKAARPEPPRRAQLGDLDAIIGRRTQGEQNLLCGLSARPSGRFETAEQVDPCRDQAGELLRLGGSRFMRGPCIDTQRCAKREFLREQRRCFFCFGDSLTQIDICRSVACQRSEGVNVEGKAQLPRIGLRLLPSHPAKPRDLHLRSLTLMIERNRGDACMDAVQSRCQVVSGLDDAPMSTRRI